MPSQRMTKEDKLQAFCTVALMTKDQIIIGLDTDLMINLFNSAAEKYFGLNAAACLNQSYTILSQYIELHALTKILSEKSNNASTTYKNILTAVFRSSQPPKYLIWTLQKIVDQKKSCLGFLLIGAEVESTKVEQENSLLIDKSLTDLMNQLPGIMYFKDLDGKYLWCNDFVVKMAGKNSILDIIGKDDYQFCWKDFADEYVKNDKKVIANNRGQVVEEISKFADGTSRVCLTHKSPLYDKAGNIIGISGSSLDISNQKDIQKKLYEQYKQGEDNFYYLSNFANNLPGSLYFKDIDGKYLWCNDFVIKMAGEKSIKDLIGKTDFDLCWKDKADFYRKNDLKVMESGEAMIAEESVESVNGENLTFFVHKVPLRDKTGKIIGIIGNSLDITDRKNLENTLKEAKEKAEAANRAKSEFLMNMSHDVKTPLGGIISFAELLNSRTQQDLHSLTQGLLGAGKSLMHFFDDCMELSKLENYSLVLLKESFDLKLLLKEIFELLLPAIKTKKLLLYIHYSEEIPAHLLGSRVAIYRIVLNLLGNAVKFTKDGSIKVSVELGHKSTLEKAIVKLTIADTGIGIPIAKQSLIFERFSRLTPSYEGIYEGHGIGLYIVKKFVEALQGEIHLKSEEGKGSEFTIVIPLQTSLLDDSEYQDKSERIDLNALQVLQKNEIDQPKSEVEILTVRQPSEDSKEKVTVSEFESQSQSEPNILLVEDSPMAQRGAKMILTALDCHVEVASDGAEAVGKFEAGKYDLVLMDIGLPDMKGYEVAKRFREMEKNTSLHVPILGLSAHASQEDTKFSIEAGMEEMFSKPLLEDLAKTMLERYRIKENMKKNVAPKPDVLNTGLLEVGKSGLKVIDLQKPKTVNDLTAVEKGVWKVLDGIVASLPETKIDMELSYKAQDREVLIDKVHKFHGGVCYANAPDLLHAVRELEIALRSKNLRKEDEISVLYQNFLQATDTLAQVWQKNNLDKFILEIKTLKANSPSENTETKITARKPILKPKVLIVEDNGLAQMGARMLMTAQECLSEEANDGREAINMFQPGKYDLVLMDIGLPDMKGYEVAKRFREMEKNTSFHVPILGLSAHASLEETKLCLDAGMEEMFSKPLLDDLAKLMLERYRIKENMRGDGKVSKKDSSNTGLLAVGKSGLKVLDLQKPKTAPDLDDKEKFAWEIVEDMIKLLPKSAADIELSYKARDINPLIDKIHKLHGGVSYTHMPDLLHAVRTLELSLLEGKLDTLETLYQDFLEAVDLLEKTYRSL